MGWVLAAAVMMALAVTLVGRLKTGVRGARLREGLAAQGASLEVDPRVVERFDRIRRDAPGWMARLGDDRDTVIYELEGERFWIAWKSRAQREGALALRPHISPLVSLEVMTRHYGRLGMIRADTFPEPYSALDVFVDAPESATIFFATAIGANLLEMLAHDAGFALEYQDGWCRLQVDPGQPYLEHGARLEDLLAIRNTLDDILCTSKAAVPYDCEIVPIEGVEIVDPSGREATRQLPIYGFSAS